MTLVTSPVQLERRWLTGHWHVACASSSLRRKPVAVRILDHQMVVFRAPNGAPVALADRCPHRGVERSLGRVTAEGISCRYHGWRFDGSGRCVAIPSLVSGRVPEACRVMAYECIEQDGYVWVWPDVGTTPSPAPSIQPFAARRSVQGTMTPGCSWLKAVENNLDWCHPAFVHRWTHPPFFVTLLRGHHETAYEIRPTEKGLVVFAPPTEGGDEPIPTKSAVGLSCELPKRVTVEIGRRFRVIVLQFAPTVPGAVGWSGRQPFRLGPRAVVEARRHRQTPGPSTPRECTAHVHARLFGIRNKCPRRRLNAVCEKSRCGSGTSEWLLDSCSSSTGRPRQDIKGGKGHA